MERILFVGSYAPTGKPGIQTLQLNDQTGGLRCVSSFSSIERPSYLALSPDEKTLYAVSETVSGGSVYAFAVGTDGSLLPRNFLPTSGSAVCHLTVDPQGNFLLASNYITGILDVFRLMPCGALATHTCAVQFLGSGPNLQRQEHAHAHFSAFSPFNPDRLIAVDLGSDKLWLFQLNRKTGQLLPNGSVSLPAGYGPRHLTFSSKARDIVYVICELGLRVLTVRIVGNSGSVLQDQSCVPEAFAFEAGASAIKQSEDGRFVYASTRVYHAGRGVDCIACYAVDLETGLLGMPEFTKLDRSVPRDIHLIDGYFLAACQGSDCILVLPRNMETGQLLPPVMNYPLYHPSCIIHTSRNKEQEKE